MRYYMNTLYFCGLIALGLPLCLFGAEPTHVYFGTSGAFGIHHTTFDQESGKLGKAALAAEIKDAGFLALHPNGRILYSVGVTEDGPGVVSYKIDSKGALGLLNHMASGDGGGAHLAVHPSGKFVMTAQYGAGSVAVFPLDKDGKLGKPTITKHSGGSGVVPSRQNEPHPHWCGFSPDGRFALVPDLGMDQIVIYKVDLAVPAIHPHGFARAISGGGPRHMRFSPDGKLIYLLNELAISVTVFSWNAETGTAKLISTEPALSEQQKAAEAFNSAAEILVHPSGQFVYSSNRGHDTVSVFAVDPTEAHLKLIQHQPVRGAFPRNINLSPNGKWLLAAGADSNTVSLHALNPASGLLTYQTKGVINVPSPICILFAPHH